MSKINKLNAEFKKATKAQKRVMIAQDVLAQLKAKRYVAESGCWVQANYNSTATWADIKYTDSVQELFVKKKLQRGFEPPSIHLEKIIHQLHHIKSC